MYEYKARVLRVIDGDTVDLDIDLGLHVHVHERCRLYGINAPETHGVTKDSDEYKAGIAATDVLKDLVEGKDVVVRTFKDKKGKYGRYLARLIYEDRDINEEMVVMGYAVRYFGGKR